ncbi:ABC transporter substrate-binding protein [Novosphingobium flavum]|uniref:ABC transporter substrate-binding protein n=1 Tax=Novosphingobium flavum TaxID=1778672 RepID=A0A7X1FTR0_9SPHN|nr:ABC transporter substrate-binding protein [Novosphingobium flavum]MBC2666830.1 ABC transporter substrate-binding protein [Novosphingobium flavum]
MTLTLSTVLGDHGQTAALKSGVVGVAGAELAFEAFKRMPDAYRIQARTAKFDVCELAPTTYLVARAAGTPITALPIPMTRRFRHAGVVRRADSPIREPKDLEGRRVGIRAYTVTAGTWTRGVLAEEYGLDTGKVQWFTEEEENVPDVALPPNVTRVEGRRLADLFAAGDLDAGFAGLAGIGEPGEGESFIDLFENPAPLEAAWFRKTGIYPIHGLITVRDEVLAANPGLAPALMDAFVAAKRVYLDGVFSGALDGAEDKRYRKLAAVVGDPLPYGFSANRASLEALVRMSENQGFVSGLPPLEELFLPIEAPAYQTEEA